MFAFNTPLKVVLEVIDRVTKKEKLKMVFFLRNKKILTSDNGIVYVENSKEFIINQFQRFAKCKINIQVSQIF